MTDLENKVATLERKIDTLHRAFRAKCELIEELLQARQPAPEPIDKAKGRELVERYHDINGSYDLMDVAGDMRDWIAGIVGEGE